MEIDANLVQYPKASYPIVVTPSFITTDVSPPQEKKAPSLISLTLPGIVIDVNPSQSSNAIWSMIVTPDGIFMAFKLVQPANAILPIAVTPSGIVMLDNKPQCKNNPLLIDSTPLGILIEESLWHSPKAYEPIVVTLSGISKLVSCEQLRNASSSMLVIVSGRIIDFIRVQSLNMDSAMRVIPVKNWNSSNDL